MLQDNVQTKLSKFMSKILRHSPEDFGLSLNPVDGSCAITDLLEILRLQTKWSELKVSDIVCPKDYILQRSLINEEGN